jgi:transposase
MYATTGLFEFEILELTELVFSAAKSAGKHIKIPKVMSPYSAIVVTLAALRGNRRQAELAETNGVSQPTISRVISTLTPLIAAALKPEVPTADDFDEDASFLVDGTLVPCWSWKARPDLYSGKHKRTGMNLQVACDFDGQIAWISDPLPGSTHDVIALDQSGLLDGVKPSNWVADRGYQGRGMITPLKKQPGQVSLPHHDRVYNRSINKIRSAVERAIAHLKTWRILHEDYRRPIETFADTIAAVVGLIFWFKT